MTKILTKDEKINTLHSMFDEALESMLDDMTRSAFTSSTQSLGLIKRGGRWLEIQLTLESDENEWITDEDIDE